MLIFSIIAAAIWTIFIIWAIFDIRRNKNDR